MIMGISEVKNGVYADTMFMMDNGIRRGFCFSFLFCVVFLFIFLSSFNTDFFSVFLLRFHPSCVCEYRTNGGPKMETGGSASHFFFLHFLLNPYSFANLVLCITITMWIASFSFLCLSSDKPIRDMMKK
jgi:hypothetical protein